MSNNLNERIQEHILKNKLTANDNLFKGTSDDYGKHYRAMRNALVQKLKDPSIHSIRLYDFRHYFCTMTLHKTKDPFYTMNQMGHKKLTTTQKYMHLLDLNDDEWRVKTATNVKEATTLLEAGFEYLTERDGIKPYRKRKQKTNNPLFFYSVSCLTVMSHSASLRAPIHQNARGE